MCPQFPLRHQTGPHSHLHFVHLQTAIPYWYYCSSEQGLRVVLITLFHWHENKIHRCYIQKKQTDITRSDRFVLSTVVASKSYWFIVRDAQSYDTEAGWCPPSQNPSFYRNSLTDGLVLTHNIFLFSQSSKYIFSITNCILLYRTVHLHTTGVIIFGCNIRYTNLNPFGLHSWELDLLQLRIMWHTPQNLECSLPKNNPTMQCKKKIKNRDHRCTQPWSHAGNGITFSEAS